MGGFEHYISVEQKQLRCGYTTGTCAAAATAGSAHRLLTGQWPAVVQVETPAGIMVALELEACTVGDGWAKCAVCKDGGDDPDVTHGTLIFSTVQATQEDTLVIEGGQGVGRITCPGLDQPVGAAAINSVPRRMIAHQLQKAKEIAGYQGGLVATISAPEGERLAQKTFNPRLGIVGGISILGTSGIVRPMSEEALIASLKLEMDVLVASGTKDILLSPGNYGMDFGKDTLQLPQQGWVSCSNYLGHALDHGVSLGIRSILLVGHLGKLVKVAGGIFQTHSKVADGRREILTAHTALAGGSPKLLEEIFQSVTTDQALLALERDGLRDKVMDSIMKELITHLRRRVGDGMEIQVVTFTNQQGLLGMSEGAQDLVAYHKAKAQA